MDGKTIMLVRAQLMTSHSYSVFNIVFFDEQLCKHGLDKMIVAEWIKAKDCESKHVSFIPIIGP